MKKFGTPILAAPGWASVYEGSLAAGVEVSASSLVAFESLLGAFFSAAWTLPVSDSVFASSPLAVFAASSVVLSTFFLVLSAFFLVPLSLVLPVPPFWFSGVAVAVGEVVGVAVTVGA